MNLKSVTPNLNSDYVTIYNLKSPMEFTNSVLLSIGIIFYQMNVTYCIQITEVAYIIDHLTPYNGEKKCNQ